MKQGSNDTDNILLQNTKLQGFIKKLFKGSKGEIKEHYSRGKSQNL